MAGRVGRFVGIACEVARSLGRSVGRLVDAASKMEDEGEERGGDKCLPLLLPLPLLRRSRRRHDKQQRRFEFRLHFDGIHARTHSWDIAAQERQLDSPPSVRVFRERDVKSPSSPPTSWWTKPTPPERGDLNDRKRPSRITPSGGERIVSFLPKREPPPIHINWVTDRQSSAGYLI